MDIFHGRLLKRSFTRSEKMLKTLTVFLYNALSTESYKYRHEISIKRIKPKAVDYEFHERETHRMVYTSSFFAWKISETISDREKISP